jgi:hypothetical protein
MLGLFSNTRSDQFVCHSLDVGDDRLDAASAARIVGPRATNQRLRSPEMVIGASGYHQNW